LNLTGKISRRPKPNKKENEKENKTKPLEPSKKQNENQSTVPIL
jgi:hypothetical protein